MEDLKKISVYLDDVRSHPEGWVRTYNAWQTIDQLKTGLVEELSLDHDLELVIEEYSNGIFTGKEVEVYPGTGYDVLLWIEEEARNNDSFVLPKIYIHTANPSARVKMELGLNSIKEFYNSKK